MAVQADALRSPGFKVQQAALQFLSAWVCSHIGPTPVRSTFLCCRPALSAAPRAVRGGIAARACRQGKAQLAFVQPLMIGAAAVAWRAACGVFVQDMIQLHIGLILPLIGKQEIFGDVVAFLTDLLIDGKMFRFPATVRALVPLVNQWKATYTAAVAGGDVETATGICRVAVALAETHVAMLMEAQTPEDRGNFQQLLELLLECANHPGQFPSEESISITTARFWFCFVDSVQEPVDDNRKPEYLQTYGPVLPMLVNIFHRKLQYPDDSEPLDTDELREFKLYRHDLADQVSSICLLMQGECQAILVQKLHEGMQKGSWQECEAAMYLMRSTAETVNAEEETQTPRIFQILSMLPQHQTVMRTALLMVGALSEWVASSSDAGETGCKAKCLELGIHFCMAGLANPDLASFAAEAFKDIGEVCAEMLQPYADTILQGCTHVLAKQGHTMKTKYAKAPHGAPLPHLPICRKQESKTGVGWGAGIRQPTISRAVLALSLAKRSIGGQARTHAHTRTHGGCF